MHAGTEVNLTADYKYDGNEAKQVEFEGSADQTYTINGNNHVIDGDGKAGALKIKKC
ncbi:hypothetical protein [Methanobrevibacter sp.]|uniref:hypothetical protein n=1 Tax=Methanobrevibacter sp. TaxID=66852 RepID=UPI003863A14C